MKRVVKVLKGGHYAHLFDNAERAKLEKKYPGLKFVSDDPGLHMMEFAEGLDSSKIVGEIVREMQIPFDGGFQTKYGFGSAPGRRSESERDTTFSARRAGVMAISAIPSPYAT